MENKSLGYVAICRSIMKHWVWSDPKKLKCWLWILLRANYTDNKVNIGMQIVELKRGEFITSVQNIADAMRLSTGWVRHFLKLLVNDNMIELKSSTKSTQITICNYDSYQVQQQTGNKRGTNGRQTADKPEATDNKDNNDKNLNKEIIISEIEIKDEYKIVFKKWIDYKNSIGDKYKTKESLQACYNNLLKLSKNDPSVAKEIVEQSMANNWKGLFELRKNGKTVEVRDPSKYEFYSLAAEAWKPCEKTVKYYEDNGMKVREIC